VKECYACATAKHQLTTILFPFDGIDTPRGMACMVKLFMKAGKTDYDSCIDLHPHVPITSRLSQLQVATIIVWPEDFKIKRPRTDVWGFVEV
jgi:hypothetical protein